MAATLAESRGSTLRFSRRSDCYEPLDQEVQREEQPEEDGGSWRTFSKKQLRSWRGSRGALGWSSLSYRRERARRRLVFLQSYKLQQEPPKTRSEKLRKAVVGAVRSALVSIASFRRMGSCVSKSSAAVSPASAHVIRCY